MTNVNDIPEPVLPDCAAMGLEDEHMEHIQGERCDCARQPTEAIVDQNAESGDIGRVFENKNLSTDFSEFVRIMSRLMADCSHRMQ